MTVEAIAEIIGCSTKTLRRKIASNPDMRNSASHAVGARHTVLYPFWLIHELFFEEAENATDQPDGDEDEDDKDDDE